MSEPTEAEIPWKPLEERRQEHRTKTRAVLQTAARLFLQHGPHRVSMNEIARHLNITKPALYNYFKSKNDILIECFRTGKATVGEQLQEVETQQLTGLEKLRRFMEMYAKLGTTDYGACMIRLDDRELPDDQRREVRSYKRAIDQRVRAIIQEGMADGSIRSCDVRLATFAILGSLNWIGQWYSSHGAHTPEEIGREFAHQLIEGLAARRREGG